MSGSGEIRVKLRILYGGKFELNARKKLVYKNQKQCKFDQIDPDLISKVVLEDTFQTDIPLPKPVKEFWYLKPGKTVHDGLRRVDNDTDSMEMMNYTDKGKWIHVYVVQDGEFGPLEVKNKISSVEVPADTTKILEPIPLNSHAPQVLIEDSTVEGLEDEDDGLFEVLGSESSNDVTDFSDEEGLEDKELWEIGLEAPNLGKESDNLGFEPENIGDAPENLVEIAVNSRESTDVLGEVAVIPVSLGEPPEMQENLGEMSENLGEMDENFGAESLLEDSENLDSEFPQKYRFQEFDQSSDFSNPIVFSRGMLFPSNEIFRKAVRQCSMEDGGDYVYLHNDKNKVSAYCRFKCACSDFKSTGKCKCTKLRCNFKVLGRKYSDDGTFQLTSFHQKHECGWQKKNSRVTSKWLAEKYMENFRDDPTWKLKAFMGDVKRKFGFKISYIQAWKSRLRAMLMLNGDAKEEYAKVWDYAHTLIQENPGSSCFVKVLLKNPEKPLFQRIYVSFQAQIKGFIDGCRPVVGLDGCHLKGAYTGQVLAAVAKDGNDSIFPIAFAVVEAERGETWGWFIDNLMRDIGECLPTFMSDRQKGLLEKLRITVPKGRTRVCVRHMYNNFKALWPGKSFKDQVWAAARALTVQEFNKHMATIKSFNVEAYEYLMKQDPVTWSRHAFNPTTKCDMLLNNVCESFNSLIMPARDKPVLSLCEWIRRRLMQRFIAKRKEVQAYTWPYTPTAKKLIDEARLEGTKHCKTFWDGDHKFEVDHYGASYVVDMEQKTCSCFKWSLTGIPCVHAMACISKERGNVEDFVDKYYSKATYLAAYAGKISVMEDMSKYVQTGMTPPGPPPFVVQPGRPKLHSRKREVGEDSTSNNKRFRKSGTKNKCGNCGERGHYKSSCTKDMVAAPLNPRKQVSKRASGEMDANMEHASQGTVSERVGAQLDNSVPNMSNPQSISQGSHGVSASSTKKAALPPKSHKKGGRPPNPDTVAIGNMTRTGARKVTKRKAGEVDGNMEHDSHGTMGVSTTSDAGVSLGVRRSPRKRKVQDLMGSASQSSQTEKAKTLTRSPWK